MKKILFLAVLAVSTLLFVSCEKKTVDPNESAIAAVKAGAMGSWEGTTQPFMGDGEFVTVTFTEKKVTVEFADETESANIVSWNCIDGVHVWALLDDAESSKLYITVNGDNMTTIPNSTFTVNCIPPTMTRKK